MKEYTPPKEPFYGTAGGLDKELNLPRESWMQDWPIEVIKAEHLSMLVEYYPKVTDDGKKYVLMTGIIEAIRMTKSENLLSILDYWDRIKEYLTMDYKVHEYHIYYWVKYVSKNEHYKQYPLNLINKDIKDIYTEHEMFNAENNKL